MEKDARMAGSGKEQSAPDGGSDGRKTYYVAVGAGQVLEDPEAAAFEFEIRANDEELNKLENLFAELADAEESALVRYVGWQSVSEKEAGAVTDAHLRDIYRLLYELGTEETKRHIESMHVLEDV